MTGGPVIDLRDYGEVAQRVFEASGHLLTVYEYRDMMLGTQTPFTSAMLAAQYARENAEAEADEAEYREEMSLGGQNYDPEGAKGHMGSRPAPVLQRRSK